jgi:pilus assembly protein Flp/PilA
VDGAGGWVRAGLFRAFRALGEGVSKMRRLVTLCLRDESGQDLIEYALLAGFISIVAVTAITNIGGQVNAWYMGYDTTIKTIPTGAAS